MLVGLGFTPYDSHRASKRSLNSLPLLNIIREKQPNAVTRQKCVLKYPMEKTCFQVQSPNSKKKCFKTPFVTMTSEHPDAVTVKNCVLKYTPETCVLVMLFSNTVTNFFN